MDPVQPARHADLKQIRAKIAEAIDASPYYNDRFKAHEKSRLDDIFLRTLIAIDPWHIALARNGTAIAGFIITVPEFGNLWSPWVYVAPEARAKALGLSMIRYMIRHWDNGRFHKISCYVRPDNHAARAVFSRFDFVEIALLKNHVFGEDYYLLERPLNKIADGYDSGLQLNRPQRLRVRLASMHARWFNRWRD